MTLKWPEDSSPGFGGLVSTKPQDAYAAMIAALVGGQDAEREAGFPKKISVEFDPFLITAVPAMLVGESKPEAMPWTWAEIPVVLKMPSFCLLTWWSDNC